jgi:hypothetical protein
MMSGKTRVPDISRKRIAIEFENAGVAGIVVDCALFDLNRFFGERTSK